MLKELRKITLQIPWSIISQNTGEFPFWMLILLVLRTSILPKYRFTTAQRNGGFLM